MIEELSKPVVWGLVVVCVIGVIIVPKLFPIKDRWYNHGKSVQAGRSKLEQVEKDLKDHVDGCKESAEKNSVRLEALEKGLTKVATLLEVREESAQKNHDQQVKLLEALINAKRGDKS